MNFKRREAGEKKEAAKAPQFIPIPEAEQGARAPVKLPVKFTPERQRRALLLVAVLQVILVWWTLGDYGFTWDEAYYFQPSRNAVEWLSGIRAGEIALGDDALWEETWEFQGIPRFIHGFSEAIFGGWFARGELLKPLVEQRALNAVCHGLSCLLISLLLFPIGGFVPALCGQLLYGSMPHVFGHAHFATTETLMATMTLLLAYVFIRGLRSPQWALMAGIVFGLGLNTKFNMVLMPIPLWIWAWWHHRERASGNMMAMTFIAPVVMFITWPWIWSGTIPKLLDYAAHFLAHQQTAVWHHGVKYGYGGPSAPITYPLEMIAVTTPLPTLLLALMGMVLCLRRGVHDARERLFLLLWLTPVAVASLPNAPKYDGVRLFFPALAGLALMAGVAVDGILRLTEPKSRPILIGVLIGLVTIPGLWGIWRAHPYELSSFNILVGGIEGAEERGYEMTGWCEAVNPEVIEYVNKTLPEGATLRALAYHTLALEHCQDMGALREDIVLDVSLASAEYHLVQNRRGFFGPEEAVLFDHWLPRERRQFGWPRWESVPDVPLVFVAETGQDFRDTLREATTRPPQEEVEP